MKYFNLMIVKNEKIMSQIKKIFRLKGLKSCPAALLKGLKSQIFKSHLRVGRLVLFRGVGGQNGQSMTVAGGRQRKRLPLRDSLC